MGSTADHYTWPAQKSGQDLGGNDIRSAHRSAVRPALDTRKFLGHRLLLVRGLRTFSPPHHLPDLSGPPPPDNDKRHTEMSVTGSRISGLSSFREAKQEVLSITINWRRQDERHRKWHLGPTNLKGMIGSTFKHQQATNQDELQKGSRISYQPERQAQQEVLPRNYKRRTRMSVTGSGILDPS